MVEKGSGILQNGGGAGDIRLQKLARNQCHWQIRATKRRNETDLDLTLDRRRCVQNGVASPQLGTIGMQNL